MSPISGLVGKPIRVPWNIHKGVLGTKRKGARGTVYDTRVRNLCHRLPIMSPISGLVGEPIRVPWNIHKEVLGQKERGEPWYGVRCQGTKTMTPLLPLKLPSNIQTIIPSNIQSNTFKAKKEQGFLFWFCIFYFGFVSLYF